MATKQLTAGQQTTKNTNEAFEAIANSILGIETLAIQKMDRLDFHEVSVWQLKRALQAAYDLGKSAKDANNPRGGFGPASISDLSLESTRCL